MFKIRDKSLQVHDYFNNTDNYLPNNSTILLRKLIISEMINRVKGFDIIDIGCGNGIISIPFLKFNQVTFLDWSSNMINAVKRNIPRNLINNSILINSKFENYIPKNKFDVVLFLGVLAHVNEIDQCIEKIASMTKKNGICIVQITNHQNFVSKILAFIRRLYYLGNFYYESNITKRNTIVKSFLNCGFLLEIEKKHLSTFPGFRFLSFKSQTNLLVKTYNTIISRIIGTELILKFIKVG